MLIKAITRSIIEWDAERGSSVVINIGETGELSDALAAPHIEAGTAEEVDPLPQLDHDGDGQSGGSISATGDLAELRAEYRAALGKPPFNGWDADELRKRMDAAGDAPPA